MTSILKRFVCFLAMKFDLPIGVIFLIIFSPIGFFDEISKSIEDAMLGAIYGAGFSLLFWLIDLKEYWVKPSKRIDPF